jgi:endonuclease YncB( thermonuclease family)
MQVAQDVTSIIEKYSMPIRTSDPVLLRGRGLWLNMERTVQLVSINTPNQPHSSRAPKKNHKRARRR